MHIIFCVGELLPDKRNIFVTYAKAEKQTFFLSPQITNLLIIGHSSIANPEIT
jgi:hypothetical protein